mmetsp:Transcript_6821/g.11003  ORF Transcript_6821/g.11003 Transcript_6821/m.11003 type:complete len:119 (+) Transcript_6821:71-427(+)
MSQGFSNRNIFLQILPSMANLHECFSRNKRDFIFQIVPKLSFDARKDYMSQIHFFEKNFEDQKEEAAQQDSKKPLKTEKTNKSIKSENEEEEDEAGNGETSFLGLNSGGKGMSGLSAS